MSLVVWNSINRATHYDVQLSDSADRKYAISATGVAALALVGEGAMLGMGSLVGNTDGEVDGVVDGIGGVLGDEAGGIFGGWL